MKGASQNSFSLSLIDLFAWLLKIKITIFRNSYYPGVMVFTSSVSFEAASGIFHVDVRAGSSLEERK